ncbi:hypothetical protein COCCADRAFT_93978 [Bipolaris zeicola 26-R-13]|uniref:Uncharacterized protein n=1 Tax=Cochliobolus carbonum (strain 26-R-13) TaxID=930089 RepID=W6Y3H8_COCC2|nr:uncharacterized protein COCCADRAFT_93978 [Bipolaris zeicola 26-R-13]EUC34227.1 hypothetical protein COCCADRAFT_93978 [Bipolaris zeicola 26-R-13]
MSDPDPPPPQQQPPPPNTGYNRAALITSLTNYYTLLSKTVSIHPSHIHLAPPTGHPPSSLPLPQLQRLGFTPTMLDLISHLPLITSATRPVYPGTTPIAYTTTLFSDYTDENFDVNDAHAVGLWPLPEEKIPQGVVPISWPLQGDPGGVWWMVDTNTGGKGEVTPHSNSITRPVDEVPEDEQWRTARPVPATEYFDGLARDLMELELLPVPFNPGLLVWEIWHARGHREFQVFADEAKAIYRQCEWPDLEKFKRARCKRLLEELQRRVSAWEKARRAAMPKPPAYTDAEGNPVEPR